MIPPEGLFIDCQCLLIQWLRVGIAPRMEFHGHGTREEAEEAIRGMLDEAFQVRGEIIKEMRVYAVDHTVERIGCALAAITLLGEDDLV